MGAYASLEQNAVIVQALGSAAGLTGTGRGIDTAGYSEALVILTLGIMAGAGTLDVKMQHADADSGYVDVTGAVFSQKVGADDNKCYIARVKLDGNTVKRWIKFVGTAAVAACDHTVTVVLSGGQYNPSTPAGTVATGYSAAAEWTV